MKKLTAIILSLILCLSLASTALATDTPYGESDVQQETVPEESLGDALGSLLPENNDPELEKTIALLSTVATYIYNYATQPEEPAVDLETVLMILSVVVTVVYSLSQSA